LITFSSEVEIIGDAAAEPLHLAGDQLDSFDALSSAGESYPLTLAVQQSKEKLWAKIKVRIVSRTALGLIELPHEQGLEEGGATALGPALVASVAMAGKRPGSRVVICTDGLANVGLGTIISLLVQY
jgi:hypothetical protein